ncbi:uncharacterized protein LOC131646720 [Vicia villosa]|uniref:uncharacterized protein LOC131646720 n=1 Tax=Vicia villosa TaxID=3911 RepID=UPI00273CD089|nr:uncharacterized protein LOC131646720 [Vicia villosa]
MAKLQKFKIFATQCGVEKSPTLSPRTSPLVQLPRPKTTLRSLLGLSLTRPPRRQGHVAVLEKKEKDSMRRHSLKDLFVSSPPREEDAEGGASSPMLGGMGFFRSDSWRVGPGLSNPVLTGFRCRSLLKRKAWRPMLLTISEQ